MRCHQNFCSVQSYLTLCPTNIGEQNVSTTVFIIWDCVLLSSIKIHSLKRNNKHLLILILALLINKNFVWAGQLIVTMLIQAVKLPSVAVTRLPLLFGLFTLLRVYLHYRFRRLLKKIQKNNFLRFT